MLRTPQAAWALVHRPSDQVIAAAVRGAFDSASRRQGLLAEAGLAAGEALIIAPSQAVHTFGMRFALDLVFADREGRVVKVREHVGPWRVAVAWRAFAVIELAAGALDGRVQVGDALVPVAAPSDGRAWNR